MSGSRVWSTAVRKRAAAAQAGWNSPAGGGEEEVVVGGAVEGVAGAVDSVDVVAQLLGHRRQPVAVAGDHIVDGAEQPAGRAGDTGRVAVVGPRHPYGLGRVGADVDVQGHGAVAPHEGRPADEDVDGAF